MTTGAVSTAVSVQLSLKFTKHTLQTTASANNMVVSDRVSNVGTDGKFDMLGSSGVTELIDRFNAPPQSNIVSRFLESVEYWWSGKHVLWSSHGRRFAWRPLRWVLPVSLSSFCPVRDAATGHVNVTWIAESELKNAGFNILQSEMKNGRFKVINVKGIIVGHGTTSEKHVYKFADTTTKPNVVYYYQIEDVSINGERTTLTATHLRGDVSPAGKLTTTWGDLKLQK